MPLETESYVYYRLKRGQTSREAEKILHCPVNENFAGAIVKVVKCREYTAEPFDDYASIAMKFGVDEAQLKSFNGARAVYPTATVYIGTPDGLSGI